MTQTQTHSRHVILREDEFARLLGRASQSLGRRMVGIAQDGQLLDQVEHVSKLAETAAALEAYLDDHGARQNRTFVAFGELVASIRGLATVRAIGLHLVLRLPQHQGSDERSELVGELGVCHRDLDDSLRALGRALIAEARGLGIEWSASGVQVASEVAQRRLLPRNLDADLAVDEQQRIAQIGARFQMVLEASRNLDIGRVRPADELQAFVQDHATEARCRWYESAVHNIQSMYDTYVAGTSIEQEHGWLLRLRGHVSISLHLLEMATELVHFYERHENDIRHEPARESISSVVAKDRILHAAVNICLRQAYLCVESCSEAVDRILDTFVSKSSVSLALPAGIVLHARPLALIVQVVRHHGTPVEISIEGECCSGNSLMGLIMLGGRHPEPRAVDVRGDRGVLDDLRALFDSGLGETDRPFPASLGYLRTGA